MRVTSDILKQPKIPIGFINDLNECASRDEVFAAYAFWSGRIIAADRTTIAIPKGRRDALELVAIDGNMAVATGSNVPVEGTMIGRVFRSQIAEICYDHAATSDPNLLRLAAGGLQNCMVVPLSTGDRRFGVLAQAFAKPPAPTDTDLALLQAIANCLASHLLLQEQFVQLGELALTDPLTQLFNRRVYEDRVGLLWDRLCETDKRFAVAIVDLDHFKSINDSYGHDFGDEVLKSVAQALTAASRSSDTVVRMGGEEFGLIIESAELDEAFLVAERARKSIESLQFKHGNKTVKLTASIGVAEAEQRHDSPRLVGMLADRALYTAKKTGRNRVAVDGSAGSTEDLAWDIAAAQFPDRHAG